MAAIYKNSSIPDRIGTNGAKENSTWTYQFSATAFVDPEGLTISYTAEYESSVGVWSALPAWLTFDGPNRTFTITKQTGVIGTYNIRVTATDTEGFTASDEFLVEVVANNAPVLNEPLTDQVGYYGTNAPAFYYQIPITAITDPDGDDLTRSAYVIVNGIETALADVIPSISFSSGSRKFSGYPTEAEAGTYTIRVKYDDGMASVSDEFELLIRVYNQPVVTNYTPEGIYAYPTKGFSWSIPSNLFTDPEGVTLTHNIVLNDGFDSPLPAWLTWNSTEKRIYGTPAAGDVAVLDLKITASDGENVAIATLQLTVQTYQAPVFGNDGSYWNPFLGQKTALILNHEFFVSPTNEPLTFNVGDLPSWCSYNSTTRRLNGIPTDFKLPNTDSGLIAITNVATFAGSGTVFTFKINGIVNTITEGTDFVSDAASAINTATNLAAAFEAKVGMTGFADSNTVSFGREATYTIADFEVNQEVGMVLVNVIGLISVTASDPYETSTPESLYLYLYTNNHAPTLSNPIPNQYVRQDQTLNFTVPANTFTTNYTLGYRAVLMTPEGYEKPLPGWISFNTTTGTFTGNPEDLEGLKTKTFQIAVMGVAKDSYYLEPIGETPALFYLTLGSNDNTGQAMAKTDAECKMVIYIHPTGTTLPANIVTASRIELNFLQTDNLNIDFSAYNVLPGDTIGLDTQNGTIAGNRFRFNNIEGLPGNPIYITNVNGFAKWSGWTSFLWKMEACNNVVFAGQGTYADPCGIKLHSLENPSGGGAGAAVQYNINCHNNVEFAWMHVPESSFAGFSVKNNLTETEGQIGAPDPAFPERDNMDGVRIQYCLVENTDGEAIYLGNGFYEGKAFTSGTKYAHTIKNVRVHDNVAFNVGWDGYQIKNVVENGKYYNNYVLYTGLRTAGGQNEGVNIGDGFTGEFYNNWIQFGRNTALRLDASGNCNIHHNVFIGYEDTTSGFETAIYGARRGRTDDPTLANLPGSSQYAAVYNNTFVNINAGSQLVKISLAVDNIYIKNNLFITSNSRVIKIDSAGEESNNLVYGSKDSPKFRDYANYDFRPKSTSPLLGAGTDMSAYGVTADYNGNAINWLSPHVGAFVDGGINWYRTDRMQALYLASEAPLAPSALVASVLSDTRIDLSWTDNSDNETKFIIERKVDGSTFSKIGEVSANVTTYSATGLVASTSYTFRVKSYNLSGESTYVEVAATTQAAPAVVPDAPTNLVLNANSDRDANISWTLNSTNESSIKVESYNGTVWSTLDTLSTGATTTTLYELTPSTQYTLRIVAVNAAGDSAPSNTLIFTTSTAQEVSTEGLYWAFDEGGVMYTGFNYTRALIPSIYLTKPNFHIFSDTSQKPLPTQKYQVGKKGDMRYTQDSVTRKITKMAFCVEDNVWAIVDFSTLGGGSGSTAWIDLTGSPADNVDLAPYIRGLFPYKKFRAPKVVHTGSIARTVLYSLTIPAGTIKANSVISIKPQIDVTNPSTLAVAFEVVVGGQTLLSHNSTTADSYSREQEVYIAEINAANNTKHRIATGTSSQEGALNSSLSKATIDWSVDQTLEMAGTLADIGDTIELTGAVVEIITDTDTL